VPTPVRSSAPAPRRVLRQTTRRHREDIRTTTAVVWRNTLLGAGAELLTGVGTLAVLAYGLGWSSTR